MSAKFDFEFVVNEDFVKAHKKSQTVMIIANNETHIVYMQAYKSLGKGLYKLYGIHPPAGKENYTAILKLENI